MAPPQSTTTVSTVPTSSSSNSSHHAPAMEVTSAEMMGLPVDQDEAAGAGSSENPSRLAPPNVDSLPACWLSVREDLQKELVKTSVAVGTGITVGVLKGSTIKVNVVAPGFQGLTNSSVVSSRQLPDSDVVVRRVVTTGCIASVNTNIAMVSALGLFEPNIQSTFTDMVSVSDILNEIRRQLWLSTSPLDNLLWWPTQLRLKHPGRTEVLKFGYGDFVHRSSLTADGEKLSFQCDKRPATLIILQQIYEWLVTHWNDQAKFRALQHCLCDLVPFISRMLICVHNISCKTKSATDSMELILVKSYGDSGGGAELNSIDTTNFDVVAHLTFILKAHISPQPLDICVSQSATFNALLTWLVSQTSHSLQADCCGITHTDLLLCLHQWNDEEMLLLRDEKTKDAGMDVTEGRSATVNYSVQCLLSKKCLSSVQNIDFSSNVMLTYCDEPWQLLCVQDSIHLLEEKVMNLDDLIGNKASIECSLMDVCTHTSIALAEGELSKGLDIWTLFITKLMTRCPYLKSLDLSYCVTSSMQASSLCTGLCKALKWRREYYQNIRLQHQQQQQQQHESSQSEVFVLLDDIAIDCITIKGLQAAYPAAATMLRETLLGQAITNEYEIPLARNLVLNGMDRCF